MFLYEKKNSFLDSHFSVFIKAFAVYKIKQKHYLNGGNAACSFRKSKGTEKLISLFQAISQSLISQAINTLKGEINLNVSHILESGMKYW